MTNPSNPSADKLDRILIGLYLGESKDVARLDSSIQIQNPALQKTKSALTAYIEQKVMEARIDEIKGMVESANSYAIDRSYSRYPFYVVEKPDVDERLKYLKQEIKAEMRKALKENAHTKDNKATKLKGKR